MAGIKISNLDDAASFTDESEVPVSLNGATSKATGAQISAFIAAGGASPLRVGSTSVQSGTDTRILYDNAGVLGEYAISGSGTAVAMSESPTINAPTLTGTILGTTNGMTGGIADALVTTVGLKPTIAIGTLVSGSGSALTVPFDLEINIADFNSSNDSDYRAIRAISEFSNTGTRNADKVYGQYQGLKFSGVGTGTVTTTYNFHGFTWLNGPTNVSHVRGVFHHIPLEGSGSIVDAIGFEAGTNVYTSTGTIVSMTGFQTSNIGGSQVHTVIGFCATDTTVDTNSAFTISSGTYDNATGKITLTVTPLVTVGLLQNVVLSGLTGTGAFASLNGTWPTEAGTTQFTIVLTGTALLGASTITGGTATVPLGSVTSFLSEQTGTSNFAIKTSGNAAVQFGGAQIQVGNVTWQGTQTTLSQNYTIARAMGTLGASAVGTTGLTFTSSFTGNADGLTDARGWSFTSTNSGANTTAANRAMLITTAVAGSNTTARAEGTVGAIQLTSTGNVTNANVHRALYRLDSSGGITGTASVLSVDPTVFNGSGTIANLVGLSLTDIGHATKITSSIYGIDFADVTLGASTIANIHSNLSSDATRYFIKHDGTAKSAFGGAVTFTGTETFGTSATAFATLATSAGAFTLQTSRVDSATAYNILNFQNYGVTAANHGQTMLFSFGTGGSLGASAASLDIISTDTWAVATNRSAKFRARVNQAGGGLSNVFEGTTTVFSLPGQLVATTGSFTGAVTVAGNFIATTATVTGAATFSSTTTFSGAATFSSTIMNTASTIQYCGGTTGADVYVVTATPAITTYATGAMFFAKVNLANTTTNPTLNFNSVAAKTIVKRASTALAANDLLANGFYQFIYNGSAFQVLNPTVP